MRLVPLLLDAGHEVGVSTMTRIAGTSNSKARRELDWEPRYRTYEEGFRNGLGDATSA
jgi:nucleoside-diphosphate-sugar epimerase